VLLDSDLATIYGVETKELTRAVRRNLERFPADFMFQLSDEEFNDLRRHFGTSRQWGGRRYAPFVFTEQGGTAVAGVLSSTALVAMPPLSLPNKAWQCSRVFYEALEPWLQTSKLCGHSFACVSCWRLTQHCLVSSMSWSASTIPNLG
jgi:hypothetical protein